MSVLIIFTGVSKQRELDAGHSTKVQTHADHSIAFNIFCTLWPCDLDLWPFDLILNGWPSLVTVVLAVLVLSCGRTDNTQTRTNAYISRLSSVWVSKAAFTPGNVLPATCCRQQATCYPATCCLLPPMCCMYLGNMYVSLCIQQQTGNKLHKQNVDGNKQHVEGNMLPGNMLPGVNAA